MNDSIHQTIISSKTPMGIPTNIQSIKLIVDQLIKTDQSIHETLKSFNERSVELQLRIKILEQELDI